MENTRITNPTARKAAREQTQREINGWQFHKDPKMRDFLRKEVLRISEAKGLKGINEVNSHLKDREKFLREHITKKIAEQQPHLTEGPQENLAATRKLLTAIDYARQSLAQRAVK